MNYCKCEEPVIVDMLAEWWDGTCFRCGLLVNLATEREEQ
jgi:hypothetical protein